MVGIIDDYSKWECLVLALQWYHLEIFVWHPYLGYPEGEIFIYPHARHFSEIFWQHNRPVEKIAHALCIVTR